MMIQIEIYKSVDSRNRAAAVQAKCEIVTLVGEGFGMKRMEKLKGEIEELVTNGLNESIGEYGEEHR